MRHIEVNWPDLKAFVDARSLSCQYLDIGSTYYITALDGFFSLSCEIKQDGNSDQTDFENNYKSSSNTSFGNLKVENDRLQTMQNRIPNGYSIYGTGVSDDITNGIYGGGVPLQFDSTNDERDFRQLKHYYAISARSIWSGCDIDNYFNATLLAPASSGFTNATGDFDKVEIIPSSGLHLFKPVATDTGAWDGTLTDVLPNTSILKATPVPSAGNNGWFDYNPDTNVLTINSTQTGGYNLYDFDVNLHAFGRKVWGTSQEGAVNGIDTGGLIGKLLFNSWIVRIKFGLNGGILASEKAAVILYIGTKGNI